MELKDILSVSGMPGLFKLVTTRSNGLIVENFDTKKRTFVSMRKHQFTPLESVAIYTYGDVEEIKEIFMRMHQQREETPLPDGSSKEAYAAYFRKILPDYNEDRVYQSDIKKVVKWFQFLDARGLLFAEGDEEE